MSKYQMIYQDLLDKIKQRVIQPNTYLPSENELMKQYGASRDTVRKALNLLLQNGYIQKNKGKGSLVLDMDRIAFPVSGVTSFKELQKTLHGDVETIVNMFLEEEIPNELKEDLYMDSGKIYHIERIRKIDGEKVILDTDYLNGKVVNGLKIEHAKNSLYEYIEKELGLKISFARKEITVVKSYTYLEDATLFQYTISKHRPDKFRFVDFARRTEL